MNTKEIYIPKKVAVYLRVSTDAQNDKYGKELQKDAVLKMIDSRNIPEMENSLIFAGSKHIYYDDGVSGTTKISDRPQFNKMMMDYEMAPENNKPFDAIAVYKIDRLARDLKILLDVLDFFKKRKIKLISVHENIDTSTPFGRAMLNIMGVIAELEIETIKERTRSGRIQASELGKVMGTIPRIGYIKTKEGTYGIQKEEAKVIKKIFNLFVNHNHKPPTISTILTKNKILTPGGFATKHKKSKKIFPQQNIFKWNDDMVRVILKDEIYLGKYYYNKQHLRKKIPKEDWVLSPTRHTAIIDKITFARAQKKMKSLKISKNDSKNNHVYLLSGLLTCDACEKNTRAHWGGSKKIIRGSGNISYTYKCRRKSTNRNVKTCAALPISATELEKYIIQYTKNLLKSPLPVLEYQKKLNSSNKQKKLLEKEISKVIKKINILPIREHNLRDQHEYNYIGSDELNLKMKDIKDENRKLTSRLSELENLFSEYSFDKNYITNLKLFSKKYKNNLDKYMLDREKAKEILNFLYDEIIIYSRPLKKTDKIAGVKKGEQLIPYKIHMKMKLPQEIIAKLPKMIENKEKSTELTVNSSRQKVVSGGR